MNQEKIVLIVLIIIVISSTTGLSYLYISQKSYEKGFNDGMETAHQEIIKDLDAYGYSEIELGEYEMWNYKEMASIYVDSIKVGKIE